MEEHGSVVGHWLTPGLCSLLKLAEDMLIHGLGRERCNINIVVSSYSSCRLLVVIDSIHEFC